MRKAYVISVSIITCLFSLKVQAQEKVIPFSVIEEKPYVSQCKNASDRDKCFNQFIMSHVRENIIYPKKAIDLKLQERIIIQFEISKYGYVENIKVLRGNHGVLKEEAIRIVSLLPKMIPGKQRNVPVRINYSLPITFKLK